MKKVAFIGTGNIATVHAEALAGIDGATLTAVADPALSRAKSFADKYGVTQVYASVDEVIAAGEVDIAHILTPPVSHKALAEQLLQAGIEVLVEKPMGVSLTETEALQQAQQANQVGLRTNQNYIFAPAHLKLKKALAENGLGRVRSATCRYVMPLRQLAGRQFGHWMFDTPLNLLLEQAVHPLSLLDDIMGPLSLETVWASPAKEYAGGVSLTTEWVACFSSAKGPAQLHISLGANYADWHLDVIGDDGKVVADYLTDTCLKTKAGAFLDVSENLRTGLGKSASLIGQSVGAAAKYMGAQVKLVGRSDPFFRSIKASVEDFYASILGNRSELDGARGARLVGLCEEMVAAARLKSARSAAPLKPIANTSDSRSDVIVLGGTGFIGASLTRKLAEAGKKVRVVARNTGNLPSIYHHKNVRVVRGSIGDADFLEGLLAKAPVVINLAHGGGGDDYEAIYAALVGGAEKVARAALASQTKKLLHVSTIAALYLGNPEEVITNQTPVDTARAERGDYARAKAEAELMLERMHQDEQLPVSLYRPGLVVGEGGPPFHSGVGFYNRDRVCLGWNDGRNPLPFVLVDDCADALIKAAFDVDAEKIAGNSFNLVGDVRFSAREYTQELAMALQRPLEYRPQSRWLQQGSEVMKWSIKRIGGRKVDFPSMRDLKSRGLTAQFNISHEKEILGWSPVSDRAEFVAKAISVHSR